MELILEPVRYERNLVNGRFLKGHTPHNKGRKWEEWMDSRKASAMRKNLRIRMRAVKRYNVGGWNARPIFALDDNGDTLGWFASANDAGRKTGINSGNIRMVLRGELKHAGGYRWIYDERYKSCNKKGG